MSDISLIFDKNLRKEIIARRTIKSIIKGYLWKSKVNIVLYSLIFIIVCVFIVAALLQDKGTFTITTPRDDMIVYGLKLSDEPAFDKPRGELIASPVKNMWNITETDIAKNIDHIDGEHNGENYLAYTFYVKNEGDATVKYDTVVDISEMHLAVDEAMRVKIYVNGTPTVYAKPQKIDRDKPEPGTVAFVAQSRIIRLPSRDIAVGEKNKYTVVVWLEGEDPDCVNSILGGSVKMVMRFDALARSKKLV